MQGEEEVGEGEGRGGWEQGKEGVGEGEDHGREPGKEMLRGERLYFNNMVVYRNFIQSATSQWPRCTCMQILFHFTSPVVEYR